MMTVMMIVAAVIIIIMMMLAMMVLMMIVFVTILPINLQMVSGYIRVMLCPPAIKPDHINAVVPHDRV